MILSVILLILKIIGIIILSVIGLAVLILLLVLFVPIRYRASFKRTGLETDPPIEAKACVSWILHIIHATVEYETGLVICVRIFGIPVFRRPGKDTDDSDPSSKKKKKEKKHKEKKSTNAEPADMDEDTDEIVASASEDFDETVKDTDKTIAECEGSSEKEISDENIAIEGSNSDNPGENEGSSPDEDTEEKMNIFQKLSSAYEKLKCTLARAYDIVKGVVQGSKDKVNEAVKNVKYYHAIFTSDLFERTFAKTKKKLLRLLKSILPRVFEVNLEMGFEDPSTTGQVIAIYSTLYALLYKHIHLKADFEENIIRGDGKLRGRIYGVSLLVIVLYYLFDKDLKKLLRLLKKEGKKNGRK